MNNFFITFAFLFFLPLERESVEIVQNKKNSTAIAAEPSLFIMMNAYFLPCSFALYLRNCRLSVPIVW